MIDIHSHILYGLDDGAPDLDESLAMARTAVADGVTDVVATPHSANPRADGEVATEDIVLERVRALQAALDGAGIPLRLAAGSEVWLTPDVLRQRHDGRAFPINGGRYILIELPLQMIPTYTEQTIFQLQVAGLTPVLAHPERYADLESTLEPLCRLVSRGMLCQITAGSLLGNLGHKVKATAESILRHSLAHVIASDAHSSAQGAPALSPAVRRAAELIGEERARAMVTTVPASILASRTIEMPEPILNRSKRRWLPWGG